MSSLYDPDGRRPRFDQALRPDAGRIGTDGMDGARPESLTDTGRVGSDGDMPESRTDHHAGVIGGSAPGRKQPCGGTWPIRPPNARTDHGPGPEPLVWSRPPVPRRSRPLQRCTGARPDREGPRHCPEPRDARGGGPRRPRPHAFGPIQPLGPLNTPYVPLLTECFRFSISNLHLSRNSGSNRR